MLLYANLTYQYDSTANTYDACLALGYRTPYACFIHGTEKIPLGIDSGMPMIGGYVRLAEGSTLELHVVDADYSGEYHKSIYTTSAGSITAVEVNIATSIINATVG